MSLNLCRTTEQTEKSEVGRDGWAAGRRDKREREGQEQETGANTSRRARRETRRYGPQSLKPTGGSSGGNRERWESRMFNFSP